jgi:membrane protein
MISGVFQYFRFFLATFWAAIVRFRDRGGFIMSSHVAMSIMLALFPFVLFVVALASFLSRDLATNDLIDLIFGTWPQEIAEPIVEELRKVLAASNSRLLTIGGVLAIYFASNGVDAVRIAMTNAYRDTDPRPVWHTKLLALAFVLCGGALALAAVAISVALPLYVNIFTDEIPRSWAMWLSDTRLDAAFTAFVMLALIGACHLWLPGTSHRLSQVWPGIILTLALWSAAGMALTYYMAQFADYSATYAGLAGMIAALIFLNLMSAILIFGAEFNGALLEQNDRDDTQTAH